MAAMTTVDMVSVVHRNKHFLCCRAPYLLRAFSISMTTRTERAMVMGWGLSKISQSTPLNISSCAKHWEWWVCDWETEGVQLKCQDKQSRKQQLNTLLTSDHSVSMNRVLCITIVWWWKKINMPSFSQTCHIHRWLGGLRGEVSWSCVCLCVCVWVRSVLSNRLPVESIQHFYCD